MIRPFSWNEFLFLLSAVQWTIALSAIAFVGGAVGGLAVALGRTSDVKPLRYAANGYIQLFQGTPLLMQLFLVFFGVPFLGLEVNPWVAAALGLMLNASAFLGEIWRGSIEAVPRGQWEAATALGLRYPGLMRYVVLPQASRWPWPRRSASWSSSSRARRSPRSSASPNSPAPGRSSTTRPSGRSWCSGSSRGFTLPCAGRCLG